jgi:hypothetical protein
MFVFGFISLLVTLPGLTQPVLSEKVLPEVQRHHFHRTTIQPG